MTSQMDAALTASGGQFNCENKKRLSDVVWVANIYFYLAVFVVQFPISRNGIGFYKFFVWSSNFLIHIPNLVIN